MWWHIWAADKPLKGCVNTVCSVTLSSVRLAHLSTATRASPLGPGSQPPTALGECQTPSSKSYRIRECLTFKWTSGSICSNPSSSRDTHRPWPGHAQSLSHYHSVSWSPVLLCARRLFCQPCKVSSLHPPFRYLHTVMRSPWTFSSPAWTTPPLSASPYRRGLNGTLSRFYTSSLLESPQLTPTFQVWTPQG